MNFPTFSTTVEFASCDWCVHDKIIRKMLKIQTMLQYSLQTADMVNGYWKVKK